MNDNLDRFAWDESDLVIETSVKVTPIKFRYKGSATSGNRGHAGRPGKVGGSAPKSAGIITSDHVAKLNLAIDRTGSQNKISSGYVGKDKIKDLVDNGYIVENGAYYKLTPAGVDLIAGKIGVEQAQHSRAAPTIFDPATVAPNNKLSRKNAIEYMKTLPGYPKDRPIQVMPMTDARSIRTPGARANARYNDGVIELPSSSTARTVVHEVGHYHYDYTIKNRQDVANEYNKAKVQGGSPLFRDYAFRYSHEFFADAYTMLVFGTSEQKRKLASEFPQTWAALSAMQ